MAWRPSIFQLAIIYYSIHRRKGLQVSTGTSSQQWLLRQRKFAGFGAPACGGWSQPAARRPQRTPGRLTTPTAPLAHKCIPSLCKGGQVSCQYWHPDSANSQFQGCAARLRSLVSASSTPFAKEPEDVTTKPLDALVLARPLLRCVNRGVCMSSVFSRWSAESTVIRATAVSARLWP